jgi:predicted outer membrane repeat protein
MCKRENNLELAAMSFILLVFSSFAFANRIIYVDDEGPADFNNIQEAVDDANEGDTILVSDGTYTGNGNRDIDFKGKNIIVKSQNGAETCIINCQGSVQDLHRGFYLHNHEGNNSIIDGFTIMNGCAYFGGGIKFYNCNPTVQNCILKNNLATIDPSFEGTATFGGGISVATLNDDLSSKILNCKFFNNTAAGSGGAIASSNSIIQNCEIIGNRANVGGAITGQNLTIYNCVINGNISISNSNYGGGAIFCQSANLIIFNTTIAGNHSKSLSE